MPRDFNKEEAALAKKIGAKVVRNSGRGQFSHGDMQLGDFLIDAKFTETYFGLSHGSWAKVCTDASKARRDPALFVVMGEEKQIKTTVVVVEQSIFLDYIRLRELEEAGEL